jgi:YHS domain-containing protein
MFWILRIIVILIILRLLWRMIMGPMRRPRGERGERGKKGSLPLVRDPVCGTYLLPDRAIKVGAGDQAVYFCSEACRARYHDGAKP